MNNPKCTNPNCKLCICYDCYQTKFDCKCKRWKKWEANVPLTPTCVAFASNVNTSVFVNRFANKKHFWKKSVVNVFNEVANTTLRVQRRILSKVRMPRVHTLFNVVSLPRTLKNIMSKSLEPHLVDCLDITCTSCRCAVCGQYKEQCSDPSHPKWNEDIFLKPTKKL